MTSSSRTNTTAILLIGFCVFATLSSLNLFSVNNNGSINHQQLRRYLKEEEVVNNNPNKKKNPWWKFRRGYIDETTIYPWAEINLQPHNVIPQPDREVSLFWHIPKSGGTTAKSIYECQGLSLANRAGSLPLFGHDNDNYLLAFKPWPAISTATYVNVDTTSFEGIDHAAKLRLVPRHAADIIFTSYPQYAIEHLYSKNHKGRALILARHPVERLISKFYYLQVATWERSYRPQWKTMKMSYWARVVNNDNEHMVKKLAGKRMNEEVTEQDLQLAMRTIKERFVVGLMHNMEESIHRFNVILGIDESTELSRNCMDQFFGHGVKKTNSNSHPKVKEGSAPWESLAQANQLDIRLYNYMVELFDEQRGLIDSYRGALQLQ